MTDILPETGSPAAGKPVTTAEYLLSCANSSLVQAFLEYVPADRYVRAHDAALNAAAGVLSARGTTPWDCGSDVWTALASEEPALAQSAGRFAAAVPQRMAAGAGKPHAVSAGEASSMLREAELFVKTARLAAGVR